MEPIAAQTNPPDRDFSTISPSARSLLLLKGLTNIPFARRTAELMLSPEPYIPDYSSTALHFWGRVAHFESRYWSIDQLLSGIPNKNILELSSGFSFRGLARTKKEDGVHYIDTDLPDLIDSKKRLAAALLKEGVNENSQLEILPLNALDETEFNRIADRFPDGPIVIVNEGLLIYLDPEEKEKLCGIIHRLLQRRGGYWITADIYIKKDMSAMGPAIDDQLSRFLDQHRVEEKKFDSFEAAEAFFARMGFVVDKEAEPDYASLSTMPYLLKSATPEQLLKGRELGKIQATWRLKVAYSLP